MDIQSSRSSGSTWNFRHIKLLIHKLFLLRLPSFARFSAASDTFRNPPNCARLLVGFGACACEFNKWFVWAINAVIFTATIKTPRHNPITSAESITQSRQKVWLQVRQWAELSQPQNARLHFRHVFSEAQSIHILFSITQSSFEQYCIKSSSHPWHTWQSHLLHRVEHQEKQKPFLHLTHWLRS